MSYMHSVLYYCVPTQLTQLVVGIYIYVNMLLHVWVCPQESICDGAVCWSGGGGASVSPFVECRRFCDVKCLSALLTS